MSSSDDPERGAWLPWHVVEQLARLNLRRPSSWRVFLAILTTCARYGGGDALLGIDDLAGMTGLSTRTVKGALAELRAAGLVVRTGRTRRLFVPLLAAGPPERTAAVHPVFTRRQERAVAKALAGISMLLGVDATALTLSVENTVRLGLRAPVTYGAAYEQLRRFASPAQARVFVGMVLDLLHSEQIQGRDLV